MRTAFYSPAPYPRDEQQRQEVVRQLLACTIDTPRLQAAVQAVADIFGVPSSAITILDNDRQLLAIRTGLDATETTRVAAFCGYTIEEAAAFVVPDALRDSRFLGNPLVRGGPEIRFYAGAKLVVADVAIGALCAIGQHPSEWPSGEKLDQLETLASEVSALLEQSLANSAAPSPEVTLVCSSDREDR